MNTNDLPSSADSLGSHNQIIPTNDLIYQHSNSSNSTYSDNSNISSPSFQSQPQMEQNDNMVVQSTVLTPQAQTSGISENLLSVNNELLTLLMQINPVNAWTYYLKCHAFNVNQHQLFMLSETMSSRMFEDHELGLWAEFHFSLQQFKLSKQNTNTNFEVEVNSALTPINYSASQNFSSPGLQAISNSQTRRGTGNPNSLLSIISSDRGLYNKAKEENNPDQPKTLSSREENVLLGLIKNHFVQNCSNKMSYEEMESLAQEIQRYFPGEDESTYFKKHWRKFTSKAGDPYERYKASGKLYSKWNNRKEKATSKSATLTSKNTYYTMPIVLNEIPEGERKQALEAFRVNLAANLNYPIYLIMDEWNQTREYRLKYIEKNKNNPRKTCQAWPRYTEKDSHILVSTLFQNYLQNIRSFKLITKILNVFFFYIR